MTSTEKIETARIDFVPLDEIKEADHNPKNHDLDSIISSLRRFGFVEPIIRNEASKKLVGGHGRVEALRLMKQVGESAPRRIVVKNGVWHVPVVCGISFDNDIESEAYIIAANRLVERGGWIDDLLAQSLKRLNTDELLDGLGFSPAEVDDIIHEVDKRQQLSTEVVPDEPTLPRYNDGTTLRYMCPHCKQPFAKPLFNRKKKRACAEPIEEHNEPEGEEEDEFEIEN